MRVVLIATAYLCTFIVLDLFSLKINELNGIMVWYPPVGLTYALLIVLGVRYMPVVAIALLIDSLLVFRYPLAISTQILWALAASSIYSLAASFLRRRTQSHWQLRNAREVMWFIVTTGLASALLAMISVLGSAMSGNIPNTKILYAILLWRIGEMVGVLTVTPFLLIYVIPWLKKIAARQPITPLALQLSLRSTLLVIGQALSIAFILYWVFAAEDLLGFQSPYLLILPLVWIVVTHGSKGFAIGILIINFGVGLALLFFRFDLVQLSEFGLVMLISCIIGFSIGAVVSDRQRILKKIEIQNDALVSQNKRRIQLVREVHTLNAELEQRVRLRTADLSAANKELEAFCYSVSHDLRTPLRGIDGFGSALLEDYGEIIPAEGHEYLDRIRSAAQHMGHIIDALLQLSRLTRCQLQMKETDLSALAAEVSNELTQEAPERDVQWSIEPSLIAIGDPQMLRIVLFNLMNNAWKFTSKREYAHIAIGTMQDPENGQAFFVRDNGEGFDAKYSHKLFIAFERLHTQQEYQGTGIGLATVQRVVHRHGGKVWAIGKVDHGSDLLLHNSRPYYTDTIFRGTNMSKKIILLVEDNPDDVDLTVRAFKKSHISNEVVVVQDGAQALEYLTSTGIYAGNTIEDLPQLILLDLHLPKVSGLEVLRAMRADPQTKLLPVVVLTSSGEEGDIINSYELGANSYIRKPVNFEQFLDATQQLGLYWLVLNQAAPIRH